MVEAIGGLLLLSAITLGWLAWLIRNLFELHDYADPVPLFGQLVITAGVVGFFMWTAGRAGLA